MKPVEARKDVAALFDRLGLSSSAYREFPSVPSEGREAVSHPAANVVREKTPRPDASMESHPAPKGVLTFAPTPHTGWDVLDSVFGGPMEPRRMTRATGTTVAFFSLNGGVGKTTLAISAARALSGAFRQAVLVNCSHGFAIEHYLHAKASRLGGISFLRVLQASLSSPVTVIDASSFGPAEGGLDDQSTQLITEATRRADMVLFDMPVTVDSVTREVVHGVDHLVVPIVPDLQSAAGIGVIESLLRLKSGVGPQLHYVLNRYDGSRSLHREIRARLETLLGNRLCRTAIREDHLVQEAMVHGLTVVDHAPEAAVTSDVSAMAEWLGSLTCNSKVAATDRIQGEIA